jgi:hypothetical protein
LVACAQPDSYCPAAPKPAAVKRAATKSAAEDKTADAKPPAAKAAVKAPVAARHGNPVGRIQAAVAAAVSDPEWHEF